MLELLARAKKQSDGKHLLSLWQKLPVFSEICFCSQQSTQTSHIALPMVGACQLPRYSTILVATQPPRLFTMRNLGGFFMPALSMITGAAHE
jgi:hypothetical protein